MDLNKHIITTDLNEPFHSSGYAVAANSGRLGSVSSESFSRRLEIESNRRIVGGYIRSNIGQSRNIATRPITTLRLPDRNLQSVIPKPIVGRSRGFVEPRMRNYDPYS